MFDDIFAGDPLEKWKEIIFHASPTLVKKELERLLELVAMYEVAIEEGVLAVMPINIKDDNKRDGTQKGLYGGLHIEGGGRKCEGIEKGHIDNEYIRGGKEEQAMLLTQAFLHTYKSRIEAQKRNIAIESSAKILSENE